MAVFDSTLDVGRWVFDVHLWKNKYGRQVHKSLKIVTTFDQDLTEKVSGGRLSETKANVVQGFSPEIGGQTAESQRPEARSQKP